MRVSVRDNTLVEGAVLARTLVAALRILTFVTVQMAEHSITILTAAKVEDRGGLLHGLAVGLVVELKQTYFLIRVRTN